MWTFIHMGPGNCRAIQSNFRWASLHFPIQSRDKFHIWKEINQMGEEASRSCFTFEWSSDQVDWNETCWRNQREGGWPKLHFWNATDFSQYWIKGLVMTLQSSYCDQFSLSTLLRTKWSRYNRQDYLCSLLQLLHRSKPMHVT